MTGVWGCGCDVYSEWWWAVGESDWVIVMYFASAWLRVREGGG